MNRILTMCLLCAGVMINAPAWAYLDVNAVHHPGPAPLPQAGSVDEPANWQRAAYLVLSSVVMETALERYAEVPSDENRADLADAVMDYQAFNL